MPIEEATGLPYRSQNQVWVMHACGHDIPQFSVMRAALLLKEREANSRVGVIPFQPAEENFGGAKNLTAPALEEVSAIFGMHNEPGLPGRIATAAARSTPTSTASSSK